MWVLGRFEPILQEEGTTGTDRDSRHEPWPLWVVVYGCRVVQRLDSLWDVLIGAEPTDREVPLSRFAVDAFYDADPEAKGKATSGGVLSLRMYPASSRILWNQSKRGPDLGSSAPTLAGSRVTALETQDYDPRNSRIQAPGCLWALGRTSTTVPRPALRNPMLTM